MRYHLNYFGFGDESIAIIFIFIFFVGVPGSGLTRKVRENQTVQCADIHVTDLVGL